MHIYRRWLERLSRRYQLIIRNIDTFSEHISPSFSYAVILMLLFTCFLSNVGIGLWLAKTILGKWTNHIYIELDNQKKIDMLADTIDDLERQLDMQTKFISTLQKVIQGKNSPATPLSSMEAPSTPKQSEAHLESALPAEIAPAVEQAAVVASTVAALPNKSGLYLPPINGMVTEPFNKKSEHYGVDIVTKEKAAIKAIASGVVLFADWSADMGWVIAIQHYNNMISICKHCAVLFKKVGNFVRAGDAIGLVGNSGELSTGPHLHFELWHQGVPLNPETFIKF